MQDKKFQIFVSSTFTDLRVERQAAVEAILSSGHIPAGMELFSAGDESQMSVIQRWIDESDIYLLILGGRYGSIDAKSGKSYTHLEYEYALSKNKPLFSVIISQGGLDEKVKLLGRSALEDINNKELAAFRELVLTKLVKFWDDTKDIKLAIHETLSDFIYRKSLTGWIRGDQSVNSGFLAEEIARLTKENSELRSQIARLNPESTSLYAGLSYSQLEELLKRTKVDHEGEEVDLFEFVKINGEYLATYGFSVKVGPEYARQRYAFEKLQTFKLVYESGSNEFHYKFTDDGHNFYLKAIINNPIS